MDSKFLFRALQFVRADPRLLAYGFLLAFGSGFGQTYFIALFSGNLRAEYGISHGGFGAVYAAATLFSAAVLTLTGRWIDHIDLRRWTMAVVVLMAAACLAMALAWNIASFFVAIFLLRQMGQGLMSHTAITSQARYYASARGRAVATAGMGHPFAEAVLPPAAILLMAAIGWRESWFVIAGAIIIVILPLSLWLLRGHGARHETHLVASRADAARDGGRAVNGVRNWTRGEVLRDYRFYVLLPVRSVAVALMVFSSALSPVFMGALLDRGVAIESLTLAFALYCGGASALAVVAARLYARD